MRYSQLSFVIATAAVVGCSDSSSPTQITNGPAAPPSSEATLIGTVTTSTTDLAGPLALVEPDGTEIGLNGDQAAGMSAVIGDEVEVSGILFHMSQLMTVQRFLVRAVGGQPVSDGVLDLTVDGFVLRLTNGGDRTVIDPPAELQQHVGDRVWIAGPEGDSPSAFGVIAILTKDLRAKDAASRRR